jgi:arsenate reductase (glutaredoxin)
MAGLFTGLFVTFNFQLILYMITIFHNPKCRKSRAGIDYLKENGLEFTVVEYIKNPISREVLKDILMKMNVRPYELVRTQEDVYKSDFAGKEFNDEEWIDILLEYPRLIKRPIVVKGYRAVIAQPPEEINRLL